MTCSDCINQMTERTFYKIVTGQHIYYGELNEFDQFHGNGKVTLLPSGNTWEGEFKGDLLQKGKVTYKDGPSWEGKFRDGFILEEGKITYRCGTIKEGTFDQFKLHGKGKVTLPTGDIWEGRFEDGFLQEGEVTCNDGTIWEGRFEDGLDIIQGKFIKDGIIKKGTFKNGNLHGNGKITVANGDVRKVEGEFRDGELHGHITITYADGSTGECTYDYGRPIGIHTKINKSTDNVIECNPKAGTS